VKIKAEIGFANPLTIIVQNASPPAPSKAGVMVTSKCDGITVKGMAPIMYTLPDDKQVEVQVAYVDAKGHPASVDGEVDWTTSDQAICNIAVNPDDSTKVMLTPAANLGTAQITATADADLGEGVTEIITILDVQIVGGQAVSGTIAPTGEQQPIPTGKKK
jgi:hypothetical protein